MYQELTSKEEYTHYGCTSVGEKHLIYVDGYEMGNAGVYVTIKGQGVKQLVVFFQNAPASYPSAPSVSCYEISANDSKRVNYKYIGFVFIIGVPN